MPFTRFPSINRSTPVTSSGPTAAFAHAVLPHFLPGFVAGPPDHKATVQTLPIKRIEEVLVNRGLHVCGYGVPAKARAVFPFVVFGPDRNQMRKLDRQSPALDVLGQRRHLANGRALLAGFQHEPGVKRFLSITRGLLQPVGG